MCRFKMQKIIKTLSMPEKSVRIGLVGKCTSRKDAYRSIFEALTHAGIANNCRIETVVVDAEDLEKHRTEVLNLWMES
jgi:CTP synthase